MSGGKGGSSSTEIPEWLKDPLLRNITRAEAIQSQEFTPYRGPEVAAFSPMQVQAMQNVGGAAEAFGMAPMGYGAQQATAGINQPETFAGGITGYSSMPLYTQQQQATAATPEGQANLAIRKELYSPEVVSANLQRFKAHAAAMSEAEGGSTSTQNAGGDGGDMGGGGDLGDASVGGIGGDAGDAGDFGGYA
jgi:hypothetical protein